MIRLILLWSPFSKRSDTWSLNWLIEVFFKQKNIKQNKSFECKNKLFLNFFTLKCKSVKQIFKCLFTFESKQCALWHSSTNINNCSTEKKDYKHLLISFNRCLIIIEKIKRHQSQNINIYCFILCCNPYKNLRLLREPLFAYHVP